MSREFFINPWVNGILALILIGTGIFLFVRNIKKKKPENGLVNTMFGDGFLNTIFGDRFFVSLLTTILGLFFLGNFLHYI